MKHNFILILGMLLILFSCEYDENIVNKYNDLEYIFEDQFDNIVPTEVYFLKPSNGNNNDYGLDPYDFINDVNGKVFHRNGLSFEITNIEFVEDDPLYYIGSDRLDGASQTFIRESRKYKKLGHLIILIIPKENSKDFKGAGFDGIILIDHDRLYTSTFPHEIGHALWNPPRDVDGNMMSHINPHLREYFEPDQIERIKEKLNREETIF